MPLTTEYIEALHDKYNQDPIREYYHQLISHITMWAVPSIVYDLKTGDITHSIDAKSQAQIDKYTKEYKKYVDENYADLFKPIEPVPTSKSVALEAFLELVKFQQSRMSDVIGIPAIIAGQSEIDLLNSSGAYKMREEMALEELQNYYDLYPKKRERIPRKLKKKLKNGTKK